MSLTNNDNFQKFEYKVPIIYIKKQNTMFHNYLIESSRFFYEYNKESLMTDNSFQQSFEALIM